MANSLDNLPSLALEQVSLDLPLKTIGSLALSNRSLRAHTAQFLTRFGTPEQITKVMEILNNMLPVLQGQGLCRVQNVNRFQDLTLREAQRVIQHIKLHHQSNTPLSTILHTIYVASLSINAEPTNSWIVAQRADPISEEELKLLRSEAFKDVLKNRANFRNANDAIKNNFNAALIAVHQDGDNISHVGANLQHNLPLALAAVCQKPEAFGLLPDLLQNDFDITKTAVSLNGLMIKSASSALKNNFDIAITAVSQNGLAFLYLNDDMKHNFDIALAAVTQNGEVFKHLPTAMKNDPRIISAAVSHNADVFFELSEDLRNHIDIALIAVSKDANALNHTNLKNNFDVVLAAVKQNKLAIRIASPEMQQNPTIRAAAGLS